MYFSQCENLNDLKKLYRALVMKYHPDLGGDVRVMQDINAEYDAMFERLKAFQNAEASVLESKVYHTDETPDEFRAVLEKLIHFDGIEIELCGSWLWISGETKPWKDELKDAGCRWSKKKAMWYWHSGPFRRSGKQKTMEQIRSKYGSTRIEAEESKKLNK